MLRYMRALMDKDLALDKAMIPLGSCTMKLNATAEMIPVTWPEFAEYASLRAEGSGRRLSSDDPRSRRQTLLRSLAMMPSPCSPMPASQGEYAGLLTIRNYHDCAMAKRTATCA